MFGVDIELQLMVVRMRDEAARARKGISTADRHSPTCWKYHVPCALDRVIDEIVNDSEDDGGLL